MEIDSLMLLDHVSLTPDKPHFSVSKQSVTTTYDHHDYYYFYYYYDDDYYYYYYYDNKFLSFFCHPIYSSFTKNRGGWKGPERRGRRRRRRRGSG